MSKIRTFVAIETPPDVRRRAAALVERLRGSPAKVRWTELDSMHWTLNFLGDVDDTEIPAICAAVAEAAAPLASFDLEVRGVGAFPTTGRPRTLWLGVGDGEEQMVLLQSALVDRLERLGFRAEARRYRPHLTLGRVRDSSVGLDELAALVEQNSDTIAGSMPVDEVVVFSSRLERTRAVHERLGAGPLRG